MKTYFENFPLTLPKGKVAVTLYTDYREYGGPEEGGWYYTDPTVCTVHVFDSLRKAKVFMRQYIRAVEKARGETRRYFRTDGYPQRIVMEFPGRNVAERDADGILQSTRPYHLRDVYRGRELFARPHYC